MGGLGETGRSLLQEFHCCPLHGGKVKGQTKGSFKNGNRHGICWSTAKNGQLVSKFLNVFKTKYGERHHE